MAPAPGFEPGSSARQAEMIGQATPRERDGGPEHFVYSLCQKRDYIPMLSRNVGCLASALPKNSSESPSSIMAPIRTPTVSCKNLSST